MAQNKQSESLTKNILVFVRDHWALVASVGYLYLSAMGMSQAYFFFNSFGINIFEFSELNDFALAAFKEPKTLLYGLGMVAYVGLASFLAQVLIKRRERRGVDNGSFNNIVKSQMKAMSFMVIPVAVMVPIVLPSMLNDSYNEVWKSRYISNANNQVEVKLRVAAIHNVPNGDVDNLALLGTTDKFIFFYSKSDEKVVIVPIANVLFVQHS
ncbi:hypothetical protein P3656_15580 [Vibrio parahaemolyticus]|uniref:hypothetical protein n=1 Tax=Vibrio parahaemolyticus TaxID=670 RepID=UPI00146CB0E1|nr:hypothetical protein [Vibrio parahaemolyticus]MDF5022572.1 hypothetical protein [Vibrio parahaemolyticus]MDF5042397.1 hypothetical protein [Vibrio parahaemolyticus]MDF5155586.1 hypothetical protein [Vibrio parahaemolyticus]MDF5162093.1 hypothetical protein [Vibrio parahaemolyticus]MDF5172190.1 hypothetical protein [Vibrio parahaemolyticus]